MSDTKMKHHLTDIHTHITPNVDDGASSLEMSLEMIRSEAEQGGNVVFLTPHSSAFEGGRSAARTYEKMRKVQEAAVEAGIPVQIYQGCEIETNRQRMELILQELEDGILPSMNGTRYVLAEFYEEVDCMEEAKYCLHCYLEKGWIPIIAHAERYCRTFATVENIAVLKKMGCLVQLNYYDLAEETDDKIRTCAQALLRAELADVMGSDAHRMNHRRPKLARGADNIREHCRAEYAENVLWRNTEKLLLG